MLLCLAILKRRQTLEEKKATTADSSIKDTTPSTTRRQAMSGTHIDETLLRLGEQLAHENKKKTDGFGVDADVLNFNLRLPKAIAITHSIIVEMLVLSVLVSL